MPKSWPAIYLSQISNAGPTPRQPRVPCNCCSDSKSQSECRLAHSIWPRKWSKQHLRIKAFFGTSENAVKTHIWIAVSIYVLVAIVRRRLGLETSLYQILLILSLTLFEKTLILRALQSSDCESD